VVEKAPARASCIAGPAATRRDERLRQERGEARASDRARADAADADCAVGALRPTCSCCFRGVSPTPRRSADPLHSHHQHNNNQRQKNPTDKLVDDPTFRKAPRGVGSILDDSASTLFVTEVFRGMAYTLKAFFDPKLTINYPFEKGAIS
jgi:hypothetical protein